MTIKRKTIALDPNSSRVEQHKRKREIFVAEYLLTRSNGRASARKAAIKAGFTAKSAHAAAYKLMREPEVLAMIEAANNAAIDRATAKLDINNERILQELARIGFSDMRRAVRWKTADYVVEGDHSGTIHHRAAVELIDSDKIDDHTAAAISEVSQTMNGVRVKFYDKRPALVDLGKATGLFKDGADVSAPVTFVVERTHRTKASA